MDLAQTIYEGWFDLRAKGRLDDVLPGAAAYKSIGADGKVFGYDTLEHRAKCRVLIPGAGPTGGNAVAGLVETYFSRNHTLETHNLHVHIVEVQNERLRMLHLAHLARLVAGVHVGLGKHHVFSRAAQTTPHTLYVHGALLGPSVSEDVLMADAVAAAGQDNAVRLPRICVGCARVDAKGEVLIQRMNPPDNYSHERYEDPAIPFLEEAVNNLFSESPMWLEWRAALHADLRARAARS